jgi:hypothetical protein
VLKDMAEKVGRPTVMTEDVLQKLEYAFMRGLTDVEACLYADIGTTTLYNYCEENPEFRERKEELKKNPVVQAKLNVFEAIESKDIDMSKWYLERRAKDEFSTKQEVAANVTYEDRLKDVVDSDEY